MKLLETLLARRPAILNLLHWANLASPASQTSLEELAALERHAAGAEAALEIGSFQGVSAVRIARALAPSGVLVCVDPWPEPNGKSNPCFAIFNRHLSRQGFRSRIRILRGFSGAVESELPASLDFAFVDGDHSWAGIETDWGLVAGRVKPGGRVCLHDCAVPEPEPWRHPESVLFFDQVIRQDQRFELIEIVHSMVTLRKSI